MERTIYTYVDNIELYLQEEHVSMICHSGSNDAECRVVAAMPYISEQLKNTSDSVIKDAIESYGIEIGQKSEAELREYLVWIAAWNIFDDEEYMAA